MTDSPVPPLAAPESAAAARAPWKPSDRRRFQNIFRKQAMLSYLRLSFGMGMVAALLPVMLVLTGGYDEHFSISYFYYVNDMSRNVLVGGLWAIGIFLFLFHGLSRLENWILNLAGLSAIGVAMHPLALYDHPGAPARDRQCTPDGNSYGLDMHAISALVFFACLAIVAVCLAKGRVKSIRDQRTRRRFRRAYDAAGIAMLGMPAIIVAQNVLRGGGCASHWLFWIECFGIAAFSTFWFVKTAEYRLLLRTG